MVVVHKVIIVSVCVLCVSLHRLKSFLVGGGGGPQSDYSVCPRPLRWVFDFSGFGFSGFGFLGFWVFRFLGFCVLRFFVLCVSLHRLKSFPVVVVVGGPQSDYSVCPRPLRRVFDFSGFRFSGF